MARSPAAQLRGFIAKFDAKDQRLIRGVRTAVIIRSVSAKQRPRRRPAS
jgi:hypothetical protein